jgi:molecular chaperone GrpE (heat shock protein)
VTEETINEVIEAGYQLEDRLIRPAMVSVLVPEGK